ncbi:hypothetical protein [Paraburkholderia sp. ZP32-5]|uniref:hypothetical protein n=1 Tax=Paraburkholderia sp. ZP32-5 TaxID=2883245 RepID=UPI003FA3A1BC
MSWNRSHASGIRADRAIADGSNGSLAFRRFLSVLTVPSRRCIRRRNTISRAFIAVRKDDVASLLP